VTALVQTSARRSWLKRSRIVSQESGRIRCRNHSSEARKRPQRQPIGVLKVWRDDMLALEIPLQAAEDIDGGSLLQPAMDGVRELAIGLFRVAAQRL
jgi:hypothetical protein